MNYVLIGLFLHKLVSLKNPSDTWHPLGYLLG
jgi:hypothetical protein